MRKAIGTADARIAILEVLDSYQIEGHICKSTKASSKFKCFQIGLLRTGQIRHCALACIPSSQFISIHACYVVTTLSILLDREGSSTGDRLSICCAVLPDPGVWGAEAHRHEKHVGHAHACRCGLPSRPAFFLLLECNTALSSQKICNSAEIIFSLVRLFRQDKQTAWQQEIDFSPPDTPKIP